MRGLVIFDLDGTLLQTDLHLTHAVNQTLAEYGFSPVDPRKIKEMIGDSSENFLKKLFSDRDPADGFSRRLHINECIALSENGQLFDGIPELLSRLKFEGFTLAVCSNGSKEYIDTALIATGTKDMFQFVLSAKEFASKAEAIHKLIGEISCKTAIMVGDRPHDASGASANNIPFIAALYGYGTVEEVGGTAFKAESPRGIFPLVVQLDLCSHIYGMIMQAPDVRCLGINGVDTSGKSTFSDFLAKFLMSVGKHTVVVHMDDFHNPIAIRSNGKDEISAYIENAFDTDTLLNEILLPLRRYGEVHKNLKLLDLDSDTFTLERTYYISRDTLVILEGVLLYRKPIEDFIDFKIFLDIGFDEVIRRAYARDVPKYGPAFLDKYHSKYIPIQRRYLAECLPMKKSNVIIDNNDPLNPKIFQKEV